ncbi:MAG: leucine-rich repeat protein [Clostridia bacterium]|nr:leucine-rich repeat protein [Clostridia bacterium]
MLKMKKSVKNRMIKIVALAASACLLTGFGVDSFTTPKAANGGKVEDVALVNKVNGALQTNQEDFYDENVVYKLPETVSQNEDISVIVAMNTDTLMDAYKAANTQTTLSEYVKSNEANVLASKIKSKQNDLISTLINSKIPYTLGQRYDTILSGFEITIKAKDFDQVNTLLSKQATLIVGEEYLPAATDIVHNDVEVYETGIFDSSNCEYQGDGVVVAVLDTGLDYTHTAFSADNYNSTHDAFTLQSVSSLVNKTTAASFTKGLTGEDVYISRKVPFAYDYADKDPDVLPINSEHGTHVAGVIAGDDDVITGVAPNAQLAIMKVFSDTQTGAKSSWILAALEDCVTLGVDIINMSLGSSCGFAREVDEVEVNRIYDSIRDAGISLIAAASNDYNATFSSEKNGSLGLTSNPDSGTVGSPSTYEAALSVASVDGVKTPYLKYNEEIIYFHEASTSSAETKHFVDDILKTVGDDVQSHDFEYVTIPGIGRSSDYPEEADFYNGKIVLVKRGTTTFEDKVRVALKEKGAAGIIIYNNVSGIISMAVGADVGAVCSISQDEGEMLAEAGTGIINISRSQVAGPFMSEFSSWGPTSDLQIKPEITAHGGEILSAIPGQDYDRLSGTSMAAPNQAGATALIRQYVKYSGEFGTFGDSVEDACEITALVNQLMMSTTDIVKNKNGLPYAVRKQGSGLVNITKATTSAGYITTFDKEGKVMDKTKLELGDDKEKTGVYEMTFAIHNITDESVSYNIDSLLITEGVSTTYTSHGDTTVTQDGYLLEGTTTTVTAVNGSESSSNLVTVSANGSATVTVKITLSDADKKYLEDSFAYGMYVEGFIRLDAQSGTSVDMSVPMLAFYGDWTEAPIFDEEYYDTHKDEINAAIDAEDKVMADAYATRVIGGLYSDYIATLGTYYFSQDPSATQIAASKEHIAISNQSDEYSATISSLSAVWAGLLRNAKEVNISIVEDATGREVFNRTNYNQRKSYSRGGGLTSSVMEIEFGAQEYNLKNNTRYTVTVTSYIDYGEYSEQNNVRNTFEFPLYVDFEAPIITDVVYRTEYDRTTKKTKLFADLSVYDNHYAMGMQIGQIVPADPESGYSFALNSFGKYVTPIYSSYNSTSTVTVELTEHVSKIKESSGIHYDEEGNFSIDYNNNSFIASCYDYAMNSATYEIRLPDEILSMYFTEETINLSPNETLDLSTVLEVFPAESWLQVLDFESSNPELVDIVNQTLLAKPVGEDGVNTATITAIGYDKDGNKKTAEVQVKVLSPGEEGYVGGYTIPEVNTFKITGYTVNKAYYNVSSSEREIGVTDGKYDFGSEYTLSMFPSESVTLNYILDSYFPDSTAVTYKVGNSRFASVDDEGTITALAEGSTIVTVNVTFDGRSTLHSGRVNIKVKDPFTTNSIYLMNYRGLGGTVEIPADRGITTIYPYAFSGYEYVEKDLDAGDVIDKEDPYHIKQMYIGDDTITKVIIPEGVTHINEYAFANLTALEEVVLPSTLVNIGMGAFYGCEKLKTINLGNVKFINKQAFSGPWKEIKDENDKVIDGYYAACALEEIKLDSIVAIGDYSFAYCKLTSLELPESSQSLGVGAFYQNKDLTSVFFNASKIKLGMYAFAECSALRRIDINAAVIASYAFQNCSSLASVRLGQDVAVIGEYAFAGTSVAAFDVATTNELFRTEENGTLLLKNDELILVAPAYRFERNTLTTNATLIASGAFAGSTLIFKINAPLVTSVGSYAFADCTNLHTVSMPKLETVGEYAFYNCTALATLTMESLVKIGECAFASTALTETPDLSNVTSIGTRAFALTKLGAVEIADGTTVGDYAFGFITNLTDVTLGDNVVVGEGAFYCPLQTLDLNKLIELIQKAYEEEDDDDIVYADYVYDNLKPIIDYYYTPYTYEVKDDEGKVVESYEYLRYNEDIAIQANLTSLTIGNNVVLGDFAFFNSARLENVDLSGVQSIGKYAFSGTRMQDLWWNGKSLSYALTREYVNGEVVAVDYCYVSYAPLIETANLTSVTYIGEAAFAFNGSLKEVTFAEDGLTAISDYAFAGTKIAQVTLPASVTEIGKYAFFGSNVTKMDLSSVETIGDYAFAKTPLTEATFKDSAAIGEYAFAYCEALVEAKELASVASIGGGAFFGTALTEVDLANAEYVGDYAFGQSKVETVRFSDKLTTLGENPFYGCKIATFGKEESLIFNGNEIGTELVETYDVSATVKVIDGVLYQVVPNGLELVSYPMAKENSSYVIQEGTVRVSARAFSGSLVENVTIASTVKALGDKAFYGCENLTAVIFTSYDAPLLEEEYDETYLLLTNLPFTGRLSTYEGLGISKYYMWNVTSNYTNFYFGASFVDYIGHENAGKLLMVKPANGKNYDSFIFSQYFSASVNGSNAMMEATIKVVAMINALPNTVTLDNEAAVIAAREAYNKLPNIEQQALVTNYSKLISAEETIVYLKTRDDNTDTPVDVVEPEEKGCGGCSGIVGGGFGALTLLAVGFAMVKGKREDVVGEDGDVANKRKDK